MKTPLPYETFATVAGVDRSTLYEWEEVYPEFSDAKRLGREWQYLNLFKLGMAGMTGQMRHLKSKTTVTKTKGKGDKALTTTEVKEEWVHHFGQQTWGMMMKNMCGWKDQVNVTADDWVDDVTFGGKPAAGAKK